MRGEQLFAAGIDVGACFERAPVGATRRHLPVAFHTVPKSLSNARNFAGSRVAGTFGIAV